MHVLDIGGRDPEELLAFGNGFDNHFLVDLEIFYESGSRHFFVSAENNTKSRPSFEPMYLETDIRN